MPMIEAIVIGFPRAMRKISGKNAEKGIAEIIKRGRIKLSFSIASSA